MYPAMKTSPSLRTRIYIVAASLVVITVGSCLGSLVYTYSTKMLFSSLAEQELQAVNTAQQLNNALVMQKGFVTYFFLDRDESWLRELDIWKKAFNRLLKKAFEFTSGQDDHGLLVKIKTLYASYDTLRDKVIGLYKSGEQNAGRLLHNEARLQFLSVQELCATFEQHHEKNILTTLKRINKRTKYITAAVLSCLTGTFIFSILLVYILFTQILKPIRRLITAAARDQASDRAGDEMTTLSRRVHSLVRDITLTETELERSYEHLVKSEKLAMVGRLAAGIAHSVRNPLTSIKMRLFSLEHQLELNGSPREDFEVISHEIDHVESIVKNFLEYSRPPKMQLQMLSPSSVVDMALQLLQHRFGACTVEIRLIRNAVLPETAVDPEQLKEVFVNILLNSCEAMHRGGTITIEENLRTDPATGKTARISLSDTGPGIPEEKHEEVFQPFFSTKDEGFGLGLSIAARIIEEHGGRMRLKTAQGAGATFIISLPIRQEHHGNSTDSR